MGRLKRDCLLEILAQSESSGNVLSAAAVATAVILSSPVLTCISTSPLCSSQLWPYPPCPYTAMSLLTFLLRLGYFSLHLSHFLAHPVHPSKPSPMVTSPEKPSGAPHRIPADFASSCPVLPPSLSKSEPTMLQGGSGAPTWLPDSELLKGNAESYSHSRVVKDVDLVPGHLGSNSRSICKQLPLVSHPHIPAFATFSCRYLHVLS